MKILTDPNEIVIYKARRKEIAARYYQRHRRMIKFAMSLNISMKTARAMAQATRIVTHDDAAPQF
jgi:hypothetical protein